MNLPAAPLPLSIMDLVETLDARHAPGTGMRVALRLMQEFGGQDVKFPKSPREGHPLVKALGEADAVALCGLLGGDQIYIPHGRRRTRRREVEALEGVGRSRSEIARALGLSARHVRRLSNPRTAPSPLPLFPDD
jgi:hypothetical protein